MSTKINHGYRLDPAKFDIILAAAELRSVLRPVYETEYLRTALEQATYTLDAEPATGVSALRRATTELDRALDAIDRTGRRNPAADFGFDIYLIADPAGCALYAYVVTERQAYLDAFEAMDGVEDYCYWDNSEGPDDIDDDAWAERGKTWARIMGRNVTLGAAGLRWSLLTGTHTTDIDALLDFDPEWATSLIPGRASRAKELARTRHRSNATLDALRIGSSDWLDVVIEQTTELAAELEPTLPDVTLADLRAT